MKGYIRIELRGVLLALIFITCYQWCMGAETDSLVAVRGKVVDADGAYLPYVHIKIEGNTMHEDSVALTNGNGEFDFKISKRQDTCLVTFSYIGFGDEMFSLNSSQDSYLGEVRMKENSQMIQEIVVKSKSVVKKSDRTIFFPTQAQRKASNNGSRLLYNMMIPELNVDRQTGNVSTRDGKAVTQCINGVEASMTEIKALRTKDIIRIDFHPNPAGQFAQYQAVVDYVVRTYDSGGYASVNASTTFLTPAGDYDFSSKYHRKKWNFNLYGGTGYVKDTEQHSKTETSVGLEPEFVRTSETADYFWKRNSAYGALRVNYDNDEWFFSVFTGFNWNHVPKSMSVNDVSYTTTLYNGLRDSTYSSSRSSSPYMRLFGQWDMTDKDYIVLDCKGGLGRNTNNRTYSETDYSQPIVSDTKEDNHYITSKLYYWHNFKDKDYVSTGFTYSDVRYDDRYTGTTVSHQTSGRQDNNLWVKGRKYISDKWYVSAVLELNNVNTTVNDSTMHEWKLMPSMESEYTLSETSQLTFNSSISCLSPSQSSKTPIRQKVNSYEYLQGNTDLANYNEFKGALAYVKYFDNFYVYANLAGVFYSNSIQDVYFAEDNKLIHTFQRGGSYTFTGSNLVVSAFLLDRTMQLTASGCYQICHSNDLYRKNLNSFFWGARMLYVMGGISFSAYYDAGGYDSSPASSTYQKDLHSYGVSLTCDMGNLYVELSAANMFNRHPLAYSYLISPIYQKLTDRRKRTDMPSINLTLTYTLDFGHKKQKKVNKENYNLDTDIRNGILKVE